uniref:PARP catalytic domain-containing protein n=1 Tax=Esox lucius TaxID=8010 RepID=A0A6Q2XFG6_ESOLU
MMWAEDDFTLPYGVGRLVEPKPVDNQKYLMYHGTSRQGATQILASGFRPSSDGMLGPGVYLSRDLDKASRYPLDLPEHQRVVIRVMVNVGRVKTITCKGGWQKTWHDYGYDSAWVPPNCGMVPSGLEENCIWDPKRITVKDTIQPKPQPYLYSGACC